jgi:diaminohydroxyphosphoribosylaminopyrimidine deaminase/5-amino-6-(5-phosphoribosylamino)uracil reductase
MPTPPDERDAGFMALALRLAERGLGSTWPNPTVGCVVVKHGRLVGRGWTQPGGRPHAETEALRRAGAEALGATVYVSLEPCAHYGRTPPCTMALIQAGVRRVVVATLCPDRRVDGQGIAQLRQAGVEVGFGLMQAEAEVLNAGFFLKERASRPLVTLKLATSQDGRIATRTGASQWLTGEQARARGHWLRATHDSIMIGSGTALADDPALTCRLPGLEDRSPVRVVLDRRLRLPPTSQLAATARDVPTWLMTRSPADPARAEPLRAQGIELIELTASDDDGLDLKAALATLAGRGITRLLVEGGARLATALLRAQLVDRLAWFQAPLLVGGDGLAAIGALERQTIAEAIRLARVQSQTLAQDTLQSYIVLSEGGPCSPASSPTSAGSSRSPPTPPAAAPEPKAGG